MIDVYRRFRLKRYVKKYLATHPDIRVVGVAGSVGKTNAKVAIATVLSERYRVRMHQGDYHSSYDDLLALIGVDYPKEDMSPRQAWNLIAKAARERIASVSDVDVIVYEINSSHAGSVRRYARIISPDVTVVTCVTPNNLEAFYDYEEAAREQIFAANISKRALINRDDVDSRYAKYLTNPQINTYGTSGLSEYRFIEEDYSIEHGYSGTVVVPDREATVAITLSCHDDFTLRLSIAAVAVASQLGLSPDEISRGAGKINPERGHMNLLRGVNQSYVLDGTVNNNPLMIAEGIRALYRVNAPQKIILIGDIHHLGVQSEVEHQSLAMLCDASQVSWVLTVGPVSQSQIAPIARKRGCQTKSFDDALTAGAFLHSILQPGGVVFVSGSREAYLEEAVKIVLHSPDDIARLARQGEEWNDLKAAFFSRF